MALDQRRAGILLHPTSLHGPFGIGDLGPQCLQFLNWVKDAGLTYWQVLPLGPTGFGDSPYQCFSAFAGNPLLISPQLLIEQELAEPAWATPCNGDPTQVDYGSVIGWKNDLLKKVHEKFVKEQPKELVSEYQAFQKRKDIKIWLADYALFRVCKDLNDGKSWCEWDTPLRTRDKKTLTAVIKNNTESLDFHGFLQFLFFKQWDKVREEARERHIEIIGDVPIYVAYDSADTWANQEMFQLDEKGYPTHVAGVPPDYFSETGQLWGNPLYNWEKLKDTKYKWWLERMQSCFSLVDIVRLDHFRGFAGYWSVPFGEETAVNGQWVKGPGEHFFTAIKRKFKNMPIIAEDLGEISPDVHQLRDKLDLPGMKIMQFAFGAAQADPVIPDPNHHFHLHNHIPNCVVYTGTHDNDTTMGWYRNTSKPEEQHHLRVYLATDGNLANWDLIRLAFMSVANTAIAPMQDFLGLEGEARMNFPGQAQGNWCWRMTEDQLNWDLAFRIKDFTLLFQRCSAPPKCALPDAEENDVQYIEI